MTVLEFFKSATKEEIAECYVKDIASGHSIADWRSVFDFYFFENGLQNICPYECEYKDGSDMCLCCPYGVVEEVLKRAFIEWLSTEIDQTERGEASNENQ